MQIENPETDSTEIEIRPEVTMLSVLKHLNYEPWFADRKSTRLNSSHIQKSRMPSSA